MTAHIVVKSLAPSGNNVSGLDWDKSFASEDNPRGYFKMVVQPIEKSIRYMKVDGGYLISGEGYIVTGPSEAEIDRRARRHTNEKWPGFKYCEVQSKAGLW